MRDAQGLEGRGAREPAARRDGQAVGLVARARPAGRSRWRARPGARRGGCSSRPRGPGTGQTARPRRAGAPPTRGGRGGRSRVRPAGPVAPGSARPGCAPHAGSRRSTKGLPGAPSTDYEPDLPQRQEILSEFTSRNVRETGPEIRPPPHRVPRSRSPGPGRLRDSRVIRINMLRNRPAGPGQRRTHRMFDRILLALDDSPAGDVATVFATALARRTGPTVHVLHVNERLVGGNGLTLRSRAGGNRPGLRRGAATRRGRGARRRLGPCASYRAVPARIVAAASSARPTPSCSGRTATGGWAGSSRPGSGSVRPA